MGLTAVSANLAPRRVTAAGRPAVLAHLLALSADDRYGRFAAAVSDDGIAAYVESIDFTGDICLATGPSGGMPSGFLHLAVNGAAGEFGASVSVPWRQRGIARLLFASAVAHARAGGIAEIHLAAGHPVAQRIFSRLGHACLLRPVYPRGVVSLR